jgi:hypothetical protein
MLSEIEKGKARDVFSHGMNQNTLSPPFGPKTAGRPLPTCLLGGLDLKGY